MTFRANFLLECVTSLGWMSMNLAFYLLIFTFTSEIGRNTGWSKEPFFAFVATGLIINSIVQALFMPSAEELTEMVRTGGLEGLRSAIARQRGVAERLRGLQASWDRQRGAGATRAITEALASTPDLVAPYLADRLQWGPELDGMQTIYGAALSTWDAEGSISALAAAGALPDRTAVLWSSLDTQVPVASVLPTGLAVAGLGGSQVAVDVLQEGTVASNRDHGLAADTPDVQYEPAPHVVCEVASGGQK
jgi:hypothetical protein